ncbi:hypothetical protein EJV47_11970 [Hymenobacter gummosus]|uniref:Endonuclease GajA/Old nuclease/RecF-like AAA domain-containing protein n=1 Tax=Hymenobacter gummosus TaxID=1776032 RepID=A0A3S0QHU1_9BACT|nr:AAA family ATPase [Hymenobacter gummosus]RTQ49537.1 hypothetical protein EJV47_11970 [Hymenobacter gummosus]
MNEQLIVKNFGPIKDATVDFKKVTVFIGPTGGGKSTLAKLAAIFRKSGLLNLLEADASANQILEGYGLDGYLKPRKSYVRWLNSEGTIFDFGKGGSNKNDIKEIVDSIYAETFDMKDHELERHLNRILKKKKFQHIPKSFLEEAKKKKEEIFKKYIIESIIKKELYTSSAEYIPAERIFLSSIENSWAGIVRDDINLPKVLVDFANTYSKARTQVKKIDIDFLSLTYIFKNNDDYIKIDNKTNIPLHKSASGIQSTIPLIIAMEWLSKQKDILRSFVIEEPELNLYPSTQTSLLTWILTKCYFNKNELIITTHSPYILSHLNLLLYAYQVAEKHPDRREAVAAIVPEASWINPKDFACYHVGEGTVRSLVNDELGLIDNNELDNISGDKADAFDQLIRINRGFARA